MNKLIILLLIAVNATSLCFMLSYLDQPFHNESSICPIVEYRYTKEYWNPDIIAFFVCWFITLISDVLMMVNIIKDKWVDNE